MDEENIICGVGIDDIPQQTFLGNITRSLSFLRDVVDLRLRHHFQKEDEESFTYPELKLEPDGTPLNYFLVKYKVNIEEYIILLLALVPHIQPNLIETIIQHYLPEGGDFPEIGGVKTNHYRGMLPTGETALFILAGNDLTKRIHVSNYFSSSHFFSKENILKLEDAKDGEPRMGGRIILQQEYVDLFTTGIVSKPDFGPDFPAKLISTKMGWEDLILNPKTARQVNDMKIWLSHNNTLLKDWDMGKKIKPGYRALFYGPAGTGKTLTATLLGKQFNRDVYRIDLSQVISKYIGETEKGLEKIFNKADNKEWILFFDEADSLFGKRSNIQSAHEKYANQEVSYLLQRVEDFPGLVILASNYKNNIDQAFFRRFNAVIHFPMPNAEERYAIWKSSIPGVASLESGMDIKSLSARYELSGSSIISAIHYASLQAIDKNSKTLSKQDLLEGIKLEFEKEEKVFTFSEI